MIITWSSHDYYHVLCCVQHRFVQIIVYYDYAYSDSCICGSNESLAHFIRLDIVNVNWQLKYTATSITSWLRHLSEFYKIINIICNVLLFLILTLLTVCFISSFLIFHWNSVNPSERVAVVLNCCGCVSPNTLSWRESNNYTIVHQLRLTCMICFALW